MAEQGKTPYLRLPPGDAGEEQTAAELLADAASRLSAAADAQQAVAADAQKAARNAAARRTGGSPSRGGDFDPSAAHEALQLKIALAKMQGADKVRFLQQEYTGAPRGSTQRARAELALVQEENRQAKADAAAKRRDDAKAARDGAAEKRRAARVDALAGAAELSAAQTPEHRLNIFRARRDAAPEGTEARAKAELEATREEARQRKQAEAKAARAKAGPSPDEAARGHWRDLYHGAQSVGSILSGGGGNSFALAGNIGQGLKGLQGLLAGGGAAGGGLKGLAGLLGGTGRVAAGVAGGAGAAAAGGAAAGGAAGLAGGALGAAAGAMGGPVGAAIVMAAKNIVAGGGMAAQGVGQAAQGFATGNATGVMQGAVGAYGGAVSAAAGPILGPVVRKLTEAVQAVMGQLDAMSEHLGKYNGAIGVARGEYEAAQVQFNVALGKVMAPALTAWEGLKTKVLGALQKFAPLLTPLSKLLGAMLDGAGKFVDAFALGVGKLVDASKLFVASTLWASDRIQNPSHMLPGVGPSFEDFKKQADKQFGGGDPKGEGNLAGGLAAGRTGNASRRDKGDAGGGSADFGDDHMGGDVPGPPAKPGRGGGPATRPTAGLLGGMLGGGGVGTANRGSQGHGGGRPSDYEDDMAWARGDPPKPRRAPAPPATRPSAQPPAKRDPAKPAAKPPAARPADPMVPNGKGLDIQANVYAQANIQVQLAHERIVQDIVQAARRAGEQVVSRALNEMALLRNAGVVAMTG